MMDEEDSSGKEVEASSGTGGVYGRDWTKGSILRNIWLLSWPVMISNSLNMAGPTIDMIWVGRLGSAAIAGVGVAGLAVMLVNSAMMGLGTGLRAMIARFVGAGDASGSNHIAMQGFAVGAAYSIAMAIVGFSLAEPMLMLFGLEPDVIAEGAAYMRIMFIGAAAMSFRMITEGIMQASGDTQTPMRITVFLRFFHIIMAPFLIFGWWLFPRLGVSGAALTNIISQGVGLILGLWILFSGRTRLRLTLSKFRIDLNVIWRMVKIGIPSSLTVIQWQFSNMVLMWIIARFGTIAVAAYTVTERAATLLQMPSGGFGLAAGVLAGQNLGAGKPDRAERSGWIALGLVEVVMLVAAVAIFLWAENIIRIFNAEPGLVELGSGFLRIASLGLFFMGIASVIFQCLNGVGDTMPPLLIIIPSVWLVQLPLAYFLSQFTDLGVYGVRWAIVASLAVASVPYLVYFRHGRWKRKRV